MTEKALCAAQASVRREAQAAAEAAACIESTAFARAVDALKTCPRIVTCASGTSGIAAKKFAHTLCCIERGAAFLPPCEAVHGGLGGLKREDVLVLVSRGGKTAELLPVMDVCLKKGAKLIGVTENLEGDLARCAQIVLPLTVRAESDPLGLMATASFVATIAIFDALIAALIVECNYTREQFGLIHPGGAVGALLGAERQIDQGGLETCMNHL